MLPTKASPKQASCSALMLLVFSPLSISHFSCFASSCALSLCDFCLPFIPPEMMLSFTITLDQENVCHSPWREAGVRGFNQHSARMKRKGSHWQSSSREVIFLRLLSKGVSYREITFLKEKKIGVWMQNLASPTFF